MAQFCSTRTGLITLALLSSGCSGQNLEGRWRGSLPLEGAKVCVTNLRADRRFDLYCENRAWVGAGRYDATSRSLRLNFEVLTHGDQVIRRPVPITFQMDGQGNRLVLWVKPNPDRKLEWTRPFGAH